jgi:hypothetical protein
MIAKAVVAAIFCFVVGVIAAVAVLFATEWVLRDSPMGMDLGSSIAVHVAKHALNAMLSGVWGVFLGFLLRIPLVAVLVQVVYAFLLEPAVAGAFPDARRFLIGGAGSAVVDDPTLPLRLDFFQGVAVYAAWIVLLAIIAYMANRSRKGKYSMSRRSALASEEVGL